MGEVCSKRWKRSLVKALEIGRKTLTDNAHNEHLSEFGFKLVESIESDETMK